MWKAFQNVIPLVSEGGLLFIAIYNDQGGWSKRWKWIKRTYNRLPHWVRFPYQMLVMLPRECRSLVGHLMRNRIGVYFKNKFRYAETSLRGMSWWHDQIDWIGGYPFEVAKPEEVFDFFKRHGFELARLKTCGGGLGNNVYVFVKKGRDMTRMENLSCPELEK
jgi:2-polyprenyl-6-hydroxyphenyl methylase/3-demethylubiquinone-9 3-methyltransferase